MNRFILVILIVLALAVAWATDSLITPLRWQVERSRPASQTWPVKRGEFVYFQPQFFDYGTPCDLRSAVNIDLFYQTTGSTSLPYRLQGILMPTTGMVSFAWCPTNELPSKAYSCEVIISGPTSTMNRCRFIIQMEDTIGYQGGTNAPASWQLIDFLTCRILNYGYSPWPDYSWVTNYVGAHGGGFVGWSDIQDKPILYTQAQVDQLISNLSAQIASLPTNQPSAGGITNLYQTSVTVTNMTIQQGGTQVTYTVAVDDSKWSTNQPFVSAFVWTNAGVNSTTTNDGVITAVINTNSGSGGLSAMPSTWNAVDTNTLTVSINGEEVLRFGTNGIVVVKGTIQLYERDVSANIRLWGSTRLAPALTFEGHPNEWGLYDRGHNGHYVAGWSIAGVEQGLLGEGIYLMNTNAAFYGRHVGDGSGLTNLVESAFLNWYTNQWVFNALSISNLTMLNGPITVKDSLYTTRGTLDTTGLTVKDAGAVTRSIYGAQSVTLKNTSGLTTTTLDTSLKLKDPTSGNTLLDFGGTYGDSIIGKTPTGFYQFYLSTAGGLQIFDQGSYAFRSSITPYGITLMTSSGQLVFNVDSQSSLNTIMNSAVITNSGNLTFHGPNGTNLCTITGSTGAIKIRGVDSDSRYILVNTNWYSGIKTNLDLFGKTNIWKYQYGSVTQNVVL